MPAPLFIFATEDTWARLGSNSSPRRSCDTPLWNLRDYVVVVVVFSPLLFTICGTAHQLTKGCSILSNYISIFTLLYLILAKYIPKFLIFFLVQFIVFLHANIAFVSNHIYAQICLASGYFTPRVSRYCYF